MYQTGSRYDGCEDSGVFFEVENPMEVGGNRADGDPPATEGDHRRCGPRLSPLDRLRGRRDETRLWSNPGTGRREQPTKGCRGTPLHNSLCGNGPTHHPPGNRWEAASQGSFRASARERGSTAPRTLRRPQCRGTAAGTRGPRRGYKPMGDTGDAPLETAGRRNGLVSGARPRSRPLPRRALTAEPGNGRSGRRHELRREEGTDVRFRPPRPAPPQSRPTCAMWGSASADRSIA
jgi:hypothetical protein